MSCVFVCEPFALKSPLGSPPTGLSSFCVAIDWGPFALVCFRGGIVFRIQSFRWRTHLWEGERTYRRATLWRCVISLQWPRGGVYRSARLFPCLSYFSKGFFFFSREEGNPGRPLNEKEGGKKTVFFSPISSSFNGISSSSLSFFFPFVIVFVVIYSRPGFSV